MLQILMHLWNAQCIALVKMLPTFPAHDALHMEARRVILLELDDAPRFHAMGAPELVRMG